MGNSNRTVLQLDQLLLRLTRQSTPTKSPTFNSFILRASYSSSSQISKGFLRNKSSFSPLKMVPAALFQKDSLNQKNYEYHQIHRDPPDSSRLRASKISSPLSPSAPSSAQSTLSPSTIDQYPKTTPSYYSLRSFFSKFTDRDQQHPKQDEKSSSFKAEEQASPVGLFGKLRQLTKLYGSAALVVYGLLGGVDFGLSFLTIYLVGAEHVRKVEDRLLEQLNWKRVHSPPMPSTTSTNEASENDANMFWTTAVVAYTIHKTILLPVRLGLTAWITPPLVRYLRKRGWKVGRNLE